MIDQEKLIQEMREDSGSIDYIPFTLRLKEPDYIKVKKFCERTGVQMSVLLRRIIKIGWKTTFAEDLSEKD